VILRTLLVGLFFAGTGCPHPGPPPVNPTPPVDASADAAGCGIDTATQDALTGQIINACAAGKASRLDSMAYTNGLPVVRCVMTDVLLDVREAPKLESCVSSWMRLHGGVP
jgi:hypothetical protein